MIAVKYIWGGRHSDVNGRKINKEFNNKKEMEIYRERVKRMFKNIHDIDTDIYLVYEERPDK